MMSILVALHLFCLFIVDLPGSQSVEYGRNTRRVTCGTAEIDPRVTICCNGLVYVKSGAMPACCGSVGYDNRHYYCCGNTIIRRDKYKLPRCCGERGYDGVFDVCVDGYLDKRTELGSHCCMTDIGWKCCPKGGSCCSFAGSGQVEIPGFRPVCCNLQSVVEKAECCANTAETTGSIPSCCDTINLRPKCCTKPGGSAECCSAVGGYCCRSSYDRDFNVGGNDRTYPEPYRPRLSEPPYKPRITNPPYRPKVTNPPYRPRRTIPPYRPRVTNPPYRPRRTNPPYRPRITNPPYRPRVTNPPYRPRVTITPYRPRVTNPPYRPRTNPPYRPRVTEAPYRPVYPIATPKPQWSRQICCTMTRRTCCPRQVVSVVIQQCCYSLQKPSCCYTKRKYEPSCCERTIRVGDQQSKRQYTTLNLKTARVPVKPHDGNFYTSRPYHSERPEYQYNHVNKQSNRYQRQETCCTSDSQSACCREGLLSTGRLFECCPSEHITDPPYKPGSNQALQGNYYRQQINPKDLTPYEEIMMTQHYNYRGNNRLFTKKPDSVPKFIPEYENAPFRAGFSKEDDKDQYNNNNNPRIVIKHKPSTESGMQMGIDVNVEKKSQPNYRDKMDIVAPQKNSSNINQFPIYNHDSNNEIPVDSNYYPSYVQTTKLPSTTQSINDNILKATDNSISRSDVRTKPKYMDSLDMNYFGNNYDSRTPAPNNIINIKSNKTQDPTSKNGDNNQISIGNIPDQPNEKHGINEPKSEEGNMLLPLPDEDFKPDIYNNYMYTYDGYEHMKCDGEPYDLGVYICCDGVLRFRIGVEPKCCSTEAYDAFMYKCCDGEIRRSCDGKHHARKTAWGRFI